jgi:uncharacterized membrane protein YqhA
LSDDKPHPLRWIVGNSRFLMISGVLCLLAGALVACAWGAIHVAEVILALLHHERYLTGVVGLLHLLDAFLVAPVLLIMAVGTYELFIGPLKVPPALVVGSLHALKVKFASMLILLMSVIFVEHVISWDHPAATLAIGGGIVMVSLTLIIYSRWAEG